MLSRRMFAGCAIYAAVGLVADGASGQQTQHPFPGVKRTIIGKCDGPVEGYETVESIFEIEPNTTVPWHIHPGTETGYVLEGGAEMRMKGEDVQMAKPGANWVIAAETPHTAKIGSQPTKVLFTHVVQKGKPFAVVVPAPA